MVQSNPEEYLVVSGFERRLTQDQIGEIRDFAGKVTGSAAVSAWVAGVHRIGSEPPQITDVGSEYPGPSLAHEDPISVKRKDFYEYADNMGVHRTVAGTAFNLVVLTYNLCGAPDFYGDAAFRDAVRKQRERLLKYPRIILLEGGNPTGLTKPQKAVFDLRSMAARLEAGGEYCGNNWGLDVWARSLRTRSVVFIGEAVGDLLRQRTFNDGTGQTL